MIFSAATPAMARGGGTFNGQIVNGTPGGGSVAGQKVTLVTYLNGQPLADSETTLTDDTGRFTFSGLDTSANYTYNAVASFQGVNYWPPLPDSGNLPSFTPGVDSLNISIPVYDTTSDENSVVLMLAHIILYDQGDSVMVREYYLFVNSENMTFVGTGNDPGVLHFSMPAGANGFQVSYGPTQDEIIQGVNGFWDTEPVRPGVSEIGYSYTLPLTSGKLDITRPIDYPTPRLDVLVPEGSLDVSGGQLVPEESMNISGSLFTHYSAQNLVPGQDLTLEVTRHSGGGLSGTWLALLVVLVVIILLLVAYILWRRRPAARPVASGTASRQQDLLAEMAALDDRFDAGEIDEETYHRIRDEKKAELVRLMRSQRGE
jgi:uncharacterized membrane protein